MTGDVTTGITARQTGRNERRGELDGSYFQGARPARTGRNPQTVLLERFPPRLLPKRWAATERSREQVVARLSGPPFLSSGSASLDRDRRRGLRLVLAWLESAEGDTWQERWARSGADAMGHSPWRALPAAWLAETETGPADSAGVSLLLGRGMLLAVAGDVVRPSLGWLSSPGTPRGLVTELARSRDSVGFAALMGTAKDSLVNSHTMGLALRRVAAIVAAKGGTVAEITVGDCLELLRITEDVQLGADATSPYFYQLLRSAGMLADGAPAGRASDPGPVGLRGTNRPLRHRVPAGARLARRLLAERRPALDYSSLHKLSYTLGRLFWRDLELHHPGIDSLRLAADVATGWKQRIVTKTTRSVDNNGAITRL